MYVAKQNYLLEEWKEKQTRVQTTLRAKLEEERMVREGQIRERKERKKAEMAVSWGVCEVRCLVRRGWANEIKGTKRSRRPPPLHRIPNSQAKRAAEVQELEIVRSEIQRQEQMMIDKKIKEKERLKGIRLENEKVGPS